jgi:adenylylsulfate kinase
VRGVVVWFTGFPASGKSTLARAVAARLIEGGREPVLLDGDEIRAVLVPSPGYDYVARDGFYRTLGNLACLIAAQGRIVLVPATAYRRAWRDRTREHAPRFVEVHVATPLEECRRRDAMGTYARATAGSTVPGVGVEYEPPTAPEVVALDSSAVDAVLAALERDDYASIA